MTPPVLSYTTVHELKNLIDWFYNNQHSPSDNSNSVTSLELQLSGVKEAFAQQQSDIEYLMEKVESSQ